MKLENDRILLTGAAGGLGQELARQLHEAGASLLLAGRDAARLEALRASLGTPAAVVVADLNRPEGVALERDGEGLSTARNRLPGTVLALRPSGGLVRVTVDCGFPLDALVTAWACEELELAPGVAVTV